MAQRMEIEMRMGIAPLVREWAAITLFAALTAIGARVTIPLLFTPVPFTLQVFFTLLAGLLLGGVRGALSQAEYVAAGLAGLPIFAGGTGGLSHLLGPTGGYLIGFIVAAFVVGELTRATISLDRWKAFLASLVGVAVIYLFGALWLAVWLGNTKHLAPEICLSQALKLGVLPFIAVDTAKALAAAAAVESGRKCLRFIEEQ